MAKVPAAHNAHTVEPARLLKLPAGHMEQTPPFTAKPAGQLLHTVAPTFAKAPAAQLEQELEAAVLLKVPTPQRVQCELPDPTEYEPFTQAVHKVAPNAE